MDTPERTGLLERERRWMRPAGIAAILGLVCFLAGGAIQGSALEGDGLAEELLFISEGDADGKLLLSAIVTGLGWLMFAPPLVFLFKAAVARTDRMRRQLLPLVVAGSVMLAAAQVASHFALLNAADDFAAAEAERAQPAPEEQPSDKTDAAEKPANEEKPAAEEDQAAEEDSEDAEEEADDRARDARNEADGASLAGVLGIAGGFAFAVGFLYTSLWAMRTGLLTRFWGSLGVAAALLFVIVPPLFLFVLVWFLAMGLFLMGAWLGGRPPAWEAGRAIPWPKPGAVPEEPADQGDGDAVEGHGHELTEQQLPEEGGEGDPGAPPSEPPRKRKRRQ